MYIMLHSETKVSKVWQKQDHKHQTFQHLHPPPAQSDPAQPVQQPTQAVQQG